MWLTIGRLILFMLSSIGYWEYFKRKAKMNLYFLPAFTVSFQITILFAAGLLNCLKITVFLMFAIGLALTVNYAYTNYKVFLEYCTIGYIFFFLMLGLFLLAVRGHIFSGYDNFSHWAIVVKNMLQTDRYPNFEDALIMFQEYPLGSATFIYYFSKIISKVESIQMFAQGYMMVSFLLPVFRYVKKQKGTVLLYMFLFTNFLFCYNIWINDLLVDTLLPLQGATTILFICSEYSFFDDMEKKEVSVLCVIPLLCTAVQIKNSGIYFAVIGCMIILAKYLKRRNKIGWKEVFAVLSPFLTLYFWKAHCSYVFSAASLSKHAMTAENYDQIYSSKTVEDIKLIVREMFYFSISGKELYCVLGFLVFAGIWVICLNRDFQKKYVWFLIAVALLYFIYIVGMCFMYIFSMPTEEAIRLASSLRYRKTVFILIYYLLTVFMVQCISDIKENLSGLVYGLVFAFALVILWRVQCGQFSTIFATNDTEKDRLWFEERLWFENAIYENSVGVDQSYMVCIPTDDVGYAYFLCKYLLHSANVSTRVITEQSQTEDFKNYNYIFFYDNNNEILNNWIETEYPEQIGKTVIATER